MQHSIHTPCNTQPQHHTPMQQQHATRNSSMRHATRDTRHATCDMRHATCGMRHATCDMRHATCSTRHARRNMQWGRLMPKSTHATCKPCPHAMPRHAARNVQRVTREMQHTRCNGDANTVDAMRRQVIAAATKSTRRNNAPFRHVLLHGPPGVCMRVCVRVSVCVRIVRLA